MGSFLYLFKKSLKNYIREIMRKPLLLAGYLLLLMITAGFIVMMIVLPTVTERVIPQSSYRLFSAVVTIVLLILTYFTIRQGLTAGGTLFRMSDVNFLFTSPVSPLKILLYGLVKQGGKVLLVSLFIIYQFGSMSTSLNMSFGGFMFVLAAYFFALFLFHICSMWIYAFSAAHYQKRKLFNMIFNAVFAGILALILLAVMNSPDRFAAAGELLNGPWIGYVPVIGWVKTIALASVYGVSTYVYICFALIAVFVVLILYSFSHMTSEYYEDVLAATEKFELVRSKMKEGRGLASMSLNSRGKARKVKHEYTWNGAGAIFQRQFLEMRKSGIPFVDYRTIAMLAVAGFFTLVSGMSEPGFVLYMLVYMNFFFGLSGRWQVEMEKPYIFLIPASSSQKCFYATLADNLKNLIDAVPAITLIAVIYKLSPVLWLMYVLVYVAYGACFIYADLLNRRLFGGVHSKNLKVFIKLIASFFIVLPGLIIFLIFTLTGFIYLQYLFMILYNIIACLACFMISRKLFDNTEYVA